MKKEYTKWYYSVPFKGSDSVRVGFIHNKKSRYKYDVIRIQMNGKEPLDIEMTIDEASVVACGIMIIFSMFFLASMPKRLKKFMRIG